ncbi:ABC transporter substrate-binding protein [Bacillus sp. REN16]|uniref:ABC transporter substrate-binding protein n=1 Tax=Bacillus sp. REN16 TaxID=2887296 RepID=UPI001E5DE04C|nr:sugar ABC transporter substrate-binding protein [Bacillus sp. REN16]MCC3358941.1 sugar ABC transporter substrate-binding protein [Bacillus sp. REN16]
MKRICSLICIALVMLLIGCSSTESTSNPKKDDSEQDKQKVQLSWSMWANTPEEKQAWENLANKVTEEYPNIEVKVQTVGWADYWTKLPTNFASNKEADIISVHYSRAQGFASSFLPLDDFIKNDPNIKIEDFNEHILNSFKYKEQQVGLPYDFGPFVVYYNKDLFDKYQIPYPEAGWSWEEFVETARKLSQNQDKGFVVSSYIDHFIPFIFSNGGSHLDENGNYDLTNPKFVEIIQRLSDIVVDGYAPPLVATDNPLWDQEQWLRGNIGMFVNGPWAMGGLSNNANFDFDIVPIPEGKDGSVTAIVGSGFSISKGTKFPEEAFKALTVLTSEDSLIELAELGRAFPARKSGHDIYYETVPESFKDVLTYASSNAKGYLTTPTWQQGYDLILRGLVPIFNGQISVEEGLKDLQQQLENL